MTDSKSEDMKRAYGDDHLWLGELDRIWWVDWTQPDADAREKLTGQAEGHKPGQPERRSALFDRATGNVAACDYDGVLPSAGSGTVCGVSPAGVAAGAASRVAVDGAVGRVGDGGGEQRGHCASACSGD